MRAFRPFAFVPLLLMAGCRPAETGSAAVDPVLASLVPPDTTMLVGVRMDAVRATPLFKELAQQEMRSSLDEFTAEFGLDPRRDISELLIASNGKDVLAMARGKFDMAKKPPMGVALLDGSTAAAGSPDAIGALLSRRKAHSGGLPAALREKIKSISIPNQIWAVSLGWNAALDSAIPEKGNMANLRRVFRTVDSFTVAADLRLGLNLAASGMCRSDQDARTLADAFHGFIGIGRLSTPDNQPDLLKVYDAIKVDQNQRSIGVKAEIPMNLLEKFLKEMAPTSRSSGSRQESRPPRRP
jgi:hypothetical protein